MSWKDDFPKENRYYETDNGILYKGDAVNILSMFGDAVIDAVITDPPYLIGYKTNHRIETSHDFTTEIANDNNKEFIAKLIGETYRLLKDNSPFYCFTSWKTDCYFEEEIAKSGLKLKNKIIWVKNNWTAGDLEAQYGQQYETILYANKGRSKFVDGRNTDVWMFDRVSGKEQYHQNQKPLDLMAFILRNHTKEGDLVLDYTSGSGSTLVSAEMLNRKWIGIEIEERYCKIARERISNIEMRLL